MAVYRGKRQKRLSSVWSTLLIIQGCAERGVKHRSPNTKCKDYGSAAEVFSAVGTYCGKDNYLKTPLDCHSSVTS